MPRHVVQVVPDLPPNIGGVGDYALGLARKLRELHGIESVFLVSKEGAGRGSELEGFRVIHIEKQENAAFAEILAAVAGEESAVLVQYVGYGFDKNGAPAWLIDGLNLWRQGAPGRPLVTMFHELYANSWPWRRAFWYSRQQKILAQELARMSDTCATSLQVTTDVVSRWRSMQQGAQAVAAAAIPSNVGEPKFVPPLVEREPSMVVFGTFGSRSNAYRLARRELQQSCALLGILEVIDVGPGEIDCIALPASVKFRRAGALAPDLVSALLLRSRAGFLNYPAEYLAKSGVFAAYCSHGMLPVLAKRGPLGKDGIAAARHYWYPGLGTVAPEGTQAIATEAHAWYLGHNLEKHALIFARALRSSS